MFKPIFTIVIGIIWWGTGQPPGNAFRATVGVLAGIAAHTLETDLARRHVRRDRPANPHRKNTT